jgi:hypothetical protein
LHHCCCQIWREIAQGSACRGGAMPTVGDGGAGRNRDSPEKGSPPP